MSIADRISVVVAIVIGLAVSTLAMNFHRLATSHARVRSDWLRPLLALFMLFVTVSYRRASFCWNSGARSLTIAAFLPISPTCSCFLTVAAVPPDAVPEGSLDLRAFYMDCARYLWTVRTLNVAIFTVVNLVRSPPDGSLRGAIPLGASLLLFVAFATPIFTRRAGIHGTVIAG